MDLYSTFILYHRNSFFCIHNRECNITLLTLKGYYGHENEMYNVGVSLKEGECL